MSEDGPRPRRITDRAHLLQLWAFLRPYRLRIAIPAALPAGWSAHLVDPSGLGMQDVLDGTSAVGVTLGGTESARWWLVAGTDAFVANPDHVAGLSPPRAPTLSAAPNPTRGAGTVLSIVLPAADVARLDVYDVRGRVVRGLFDGPLPAGLHRFVWPGDGGPPAVAGVYFVRLRTSTASVDRKVVVSGR